MVRASKKTGKKNRDIKKNLTLDQIKYLTGLNLWNYGGICKAMMIRQLKQREDNMNKKKDSKKIKKKLSVKDKFNKELSKKLKDRFSGIKTKDMGDGIMEISFN